MDNKEITASGPDNSPPQPEPQGTCPRESTESTAPDQPTDQPDQQVEHSTQDSQPAEQANQPQEPQTKDQQYLTSLISYGRMKDLGEFSRPKGVKLPIGSTVVVRTERGIELGRVVLGYCEGKGERGVSREKWQRYVSQSGKGPEVSRAGRVIRLASEQDIADQDHINENSAAKLALCRQLAKDMGLTMELVDVEHLFGGDRIIFYFKSENRVDFRRLVRRLAKEYQTRIEMRQVGARDEARLLADYERCGRECCCRSFLKNLAPVNMRMAKVQKATLDPAKISGRCGRLMCCLRYEHSTYEQLRKKLPPRNTVVQTPQGEAVVVDRQILTQLVMVRFPDAKRLAYPLEEITPLSKTASDSGNNHKQSNSRANNRSASQQSGDSTPDSDNQQTKPKKRRRRRRRKPNPPAQQ